MKKTILLTSLDKQQYPDAFVECTVVDDIKSYVLSKIEQGVIPQKAQKQACVTARDGYVGEELATLIRVFRNGQMYILEETTNTVVVEGSKVVRNPDGEEYIVKPNVFAEKYAPTDQPDTFSPIAQPVSFIRLDEDIEFMGPWHSRVVALKGGVLIISNPDKIYPIQNIAFDSTYAPVVEDEDVCTG